MWRALRFFVILGLAVVGAAWVSENGKFVTLHWSEYLVEVHVVVIAAALIGIVALARIWGWARNVPGRVSKIFEDRRRKKGYLALTRGMVAVAAGDGEEARRQTKRAEALLAEPALTLLLSAQTAQLSGDTRAAQKFFDAMLERPDTEFLGIRGQLTQAMKSGDRDKALQLAHRANRLKPKSEWVASNLFDLQVRAAQWLDASDTLAVSVKNKLVKDTSARRHKAALDYLIGLDAQTAGDRAQSMRHMRKAHDHDPGFIPASSRYAGLLLSEGQHRKAAAVVEKAWSHAPHPALRTAYFDAREVMDPTQKVTAAQRLAKVNPHHLDSRLAVAKAALDARLWGEARKHLDAEAADNPCARMCRLMADLAENADGDGAAAKQWLARASVAEPDPAWVCEQCGHAQTDWTATCGKCENFNTLDWRMPARAPSPHPEDEPDAVIAPSPDVPLSLLKPEIQ